MAYAQAPVKLTDASGWLYTWAWAIEKKSQSKTTPGSSSPGPRRRSTRNWSVHRTAGQRCRPASASRPIRTRVQEGGRSVRRGDTQGDRGGRPGQSWCPAAANVGIQFVDIPEFTDLGTKVSQDISAVIADKKSVDDALNNGQKLAEAV